MAYANRNETKHLPYGEGTLRADPLRKKRQPDRKSYWIERDRSGPPASMVNQF